MTVNRRDIILGSVPILAGAGLLSSKKAEAAQSSSGSSLNLNKIGLFPHPSKDQTKLIQTAIDLAAKQKVRLSLPGGIYISGPLKLRTGSHIDGVKGSTILKFSGGGSFIGGESLNSITLLNLIIDGDLRPFKRTQAYGLIHLSKVSSLFIEGCEIKNSLLNGVSLRSCDGVIDANFITQCGMTGLFTLDSKRMTISQNEISHCSNNGVLIWRSSKGADGSILSQNHIHHIKAKAGGTGQNGNGVNVYRAGNVIVNGNVISDCAFSAVRNNAGDNVQILNNSCSRLGEVALYSEFGFEGAVISNNLVDEAHVGISITNFNEGGRLATATGNLIRNLKKRKGKFAIGIAVEADTMVTGNVIEAVPGIGISVGYGKYMRHVTVNNNLVRQTHIGVGVSTHNDAGFSLIATNMITDASKGAVRAMDLEKPIGPDLSKSSSEAFRNLAVYGNVSV